MRPTYGKMGFAGLGSLSVNSMIGPQRARLPLFIFSGFSNLKRIQVRECEGAFTRHAGRVRSPLPPQTSRLPFLGSWFPDSRERSQVREREGAHSPDTRGACAPRSRTNFYHYFRVPGFLVSKFKRGSKFANARAHSPDTRGRVRSPSPTDFSRSFPGF
jgi:hypothetical protein